MMTKIFSDVTEYFFRMPRFAPAIFSAFLCGLLLLFYRELEQGLRSFLVPSLVVYALGSALIGTLHRHLGLIYVKPDDHNTEKHIPKGWKIAIFALHLILFCLWILYNSYRCVF